MQLSGIAATVRDEIAVGPMNLGWPVEQIRAAADDAMQRLGIGHLADRAPRALSGGEQQRVLLAALAATSPTLWLLDEPFSALDATSRAHVQRWLRGLTRGGATVVIACDEADTMAGIADRLVVLQHGAVALDGAPSTLLASDAILATGAATTEAAALAAAAQMPAPRPILAASLLGAVGLAAQTEVVEMVAAPLAAGTPLLECRDVQFAYRDGPAVLRGVSVAVHAGEAVGVFGANGAGKSTLLRLAMALDHPTSGTVTVRGLETRGRHPEELAPAVGFLFQQPERQLFSASVRAECAVGPRLAGGSSAQVDDAVAAVLTELGLEDVADEHPYDLPVPRRRLVALAAVLATDPNSCCSTSRPPRWTVRPAAESRASSEREWRAGGRWWQSRTTPLSPTRHSTAPSGCAMGRSFATGRPGVSSPPVGMTFPPHWSPPSPSTFRPGRIVSWRSRPRFRAAKRARFHQCPCHSSPCSLRRCTRRVPPERIRPATRARCRCWRVPSGARRSPSRSMTMVSWSMASRFPRMRRASPRSSRRWPNSAWVA
ncbi:MAG: ATP-binding cassette domain-containing protein [Gemmatimonadetes bacterium]|nr:ATP-binding cassette domain-containing protein [Gemmatimonadota bacterium]